MPEQQTKISFLSRVSLLLSAPSRKFAWFMLVLLVIVTGLLIKPALDLQNDDDVIKFLPQDDEKVVIFKDIGDRFHGLQMAIIGVEAKRNPDIFNLEDMMLIRHISRELNLLECTNKNTGETAFCVSNTTSFSEIKDIAHSTRDTGEEEASVTDLVPDLPMLGTPEANDPSVLTLLEDVKKRTLSLDHVRGFLVSPDARAAAIYAQVNDTEVSTKEAADKIREKVENLEKTLGVDVTFYYGGSPFIGGYSADQARLDMGKLSPWVIAIVILIILITCRSIFATLVALLSVGISMVWVMAGMELFNLKLTLVATSLPILLVALGSAYAIHLITAILAQLDNGVARKEAIHEALVLTGPPIIVCVLTTAAGFFSFLTMDVEPMTQYGATMGIATIIIMLITFWFVTAACTVLPLKARQGERAPKWALNLMKRCANGIHSHGMTAAIIVAVIAVVAGYYTTKVEPHGDNSSLFAEGSLPVVADDFMNDNFGGSNFIQTEVRGVLKEDGTRERIDTPMVLRQIERMTAYINAHPRIAGMQSISDVVVLVGGTMGDGQHIPASPTLTATLGSLAFADDASVAMMAQMDWTSTLMQIRVKGKDISEGARLADEIHEQTYKFYQPRITVPREKMDKAAVELEQHEIIEHLQLIFKKYGKVLNHNDLHAVVFGMETSLNRDDVRMVTNINLFDENDALIYMDEDKIKAEACIKSCAEDVFKPETPAEEVEVAADVAAAANALVADPNAENGENDTVDEGPKCMRSDRSEECMAYFAEQYEGEALDVITDEIYNAMANHAYSKEWLGNLLRQYAADGELDNEEAFMKSVDFIVTAFSDQGKEKLRKVRTQKIFEFAGVTDPSEKFNQLVESAVWCLGDDVAFLPKNDVSPEVLAAATASQEFEVIPSGYPVIYRAMNASVIHNQIWSLCASFLMVFLCLVFFTRSLIVAIFALIPASMTVLITFGTMGFFDIGMDVGSSMIAAISLSVGIDYACHLIWKFGRPGTDPKAQQKASDHMLTTTGWGIVINALEVGLGLSVLYFGELLPMRNFGILTGFAMIISALASLLLLSGLLRLAFRIRGCFGLEKQAVTEPEVEVADKPEEVGKSEEDEDKSDKSVESGKPDKSEDENKSEDEDKSGKSKEDEDKSDKSVETEDREESKKSE